MERYRFCAFTKPHARDVIKNVLEEKTVNLDVYYFRDYVAEKLFEFLHTQRKAVSNLYKDETGILVTSQKVINRLLLLCG